MAMPDDLPAVRDRALLLLGYAGAFRRSELVALDVEQLRFSKAGLYGWIAAAKNDPRKKGASCTCRGCRRTRRAARSAPSRRFNGGWVLLARRVRCFGPSIYVDG